MKNKISSSSKYKVRISFDDYSSVNDIIVTYYLPLIRSEAFALYFALLIDARNNMINSIYVSIDRIISITNISIEEIENAISRLEIVNLIEVLINEEGKIIFEIKEPLSSKEFNNSEQMIELLKSSIGNDNLYVSNRLFNSLREYNKDGFKSITKNIDISTRKELKKAKLNVDFDFSQIKNVLLSKNIDWNKYWNNDLENSLLSLIIIYKITSFDISLELIKEIESGTFNLNNLISRIKKEYLKNEIIDSIIFSGEITTETKLDFLRKTTVNNYFIYKLNREPSPLEEKMILILVKKYGFDDYRMNILIDYSITVNNGAINKNYIYKISDTIIKERIDTPEKIIQHLKVSYKMKRNKENKNSLISKKEMKNKPIF